MKIIIGRRSPRQRSTKGERKRLHARFEKLDLELAIGDGLRLPDQLMQPLFGNGTVALLVDIDSVRSARWLSIDEQAKSHGGSRRRRPHDEVKIAGMKTIGDPTVGFVQRGGLFPDRP